MDRVRSATRSRRRASRRNAPAVAHYLEASRTDSIYVICAGSAGRFTVEDFLGASMIPSYMNTGGWRLNDAAWLALDFMERYRGRTLDALRQARAGRWFIENDRVDAMTFVADVGASALVPEVRDGRLRRVDDWQRDEALEVSDVR